MTDFWTAFIWGLGVSCGGAIGCFALGLAMAAFNWASGRAGKYAARVAYDVEALARLTERNELTHETNECLERMAEAVEGNKTRFGG